MPVPTSGRIYRHRRCEEQPNTQVEHWCLPSYVQIGDVIEYTGTGGSTAIKDTRFIVGVNMEQQANEACSELINNSGWSDEWGVTLWLSSLNGTTQMGAISVHPDYGFEVVGGKCTNCCKGANPEDYNVNSGPGVGASEFWGWNFDWQSSALGQGAYPDFTFMSSVDGGFSTTFSGPTSFSDGLLDGAACLQYCEDEDDNTVDFTDPGEYDNYAFKPKKQPSSEPIDPQVLRMKKLAGLDTPEEPKK
jgi:hypothetical protein